MKNAANGERELVPNYRVPLSGAEQAAVYWRERYEEVAEELRQIKNEPRARRMPRAYTIELRDAREFLRHDTPEPITFETIPSILKSAAEFAQAATGERFSIKDAQSPCRKAPLVRFRGAMEWYLRKVRKWSYPKIGKHMGQRDHASVMYLIGKMDAELNPLLPAPVEQEQAA